MEAKYAILNRKEGLIIPEGVNKSEGLLVNELFYDTIQGEGPTAGTPSVFLRLQGCTLDCVWCDTEWRHGEFFTFDSLLYLMDRYDIAHKLWQGHHLILTGGSPLKQQDNIIRFISAFDFKFGFVPKIEVENECVITPKMDLVDFVSHWNNSPKLSNSGMKLSARYKPKVIEAMSFLPNSIFKFVIGKQEDWEEIKAGFLDVGIIRKQQIVLMPLAATYEELLVSRSLAASIAVEHGVRYSSREQLVLGVP